MESDLSTADVEQVVMAGLCEMAAAIPDVPEPDLRAAVVEMLATQEMPPAGRYEHMDRGQQAVLLVVPADPAAAVTVTLADPDSFDSLTVELPQLEARAMWSAAGVVEKTRGFVADTYETMLGELDYQVACYRQGRAPQPPDQRAIVGMDVANDGEMVLAQVAPDGTVTIPQAATIDTATAARLLGFDDRQTSMLSTIAAGDCTHPGLPPANSVAPFERRSCPTCGQRMQAYPGSTTDDGEPEWSAIP